MKNLVFKVVGAFLLVEAVTNMTNAVDMVKNGEQSKTAQNINTALKAAKERFKKRSEEVDA